LPLIFCFAVPKQRAALSINISALPPAISTAAAQIGPLSAISSTSSTGPLSAGTTIKRRGTLDEADYLVGPQKSIHRSKRADPRVSMASIFMEILNELKGLEGSEHFAVPVNVKKVKNKLNKYLIFYLKVPDYLDIVKKPMDLQHIRKNVTENKYELRRQFLSGKFWKLIFKK
jgi:hypothetical protein